MRALMYTMVASRLVMTCCSCSFLGAFLFYAIVCLILIPSFLRSPPLPPSLFEPQNDRVLADFHANFCSLTPHSLPGRCERALERKFFFGLATAPAHVEDELYDSWLEFARGNSRKKLVRAWHNVPFPEERLRFWSEPDVELKLAKEAGATVFRMGIDWGRIVTSEPLSGTEKTADKTVVEHYKWILRRVHDHDMKVMLTLFHHSMPKWALSYGGWTEYRTVTYYVDFVRYAKQEFQSNVDYWVTFNEPHIFVMLSHCFGAWPPGRKLSIVQSLFCFTPFGHFGKAMDSIIKAHTMAYDVLHEGGSKSLVGVAHHVGIIRPYSLLDVPIALISGWLTQFHWIDDIQHHLDFCGLNYYGQEILSVAGLLLAKDEEYSEAGRAVYPNGLYELLMAFWYRYKTHSPTLRYIITENGFADAHDSLRRPYLVEHLLAIYAAIRQGVPVDGYLHWTIADNWEWADGYCPKFGLVDVDRTGNLTRYPRPSHKLYHKIATSGTITSKQREREWATLQAEMKRGGSRPFCRTTDRFNRMWAESMDRPLMRPIVERDWRFGHYQIHGFLVYVWRSFEVVKILMHDALLFLFER